MIKASEVWKCFGRLKADERALRARAFAAVTADAGGVIDVALLSWIGAGLFLAPAIAGGREAPRQALLVNLLFWATLIIVAGVLVGDYLGIMGHIQKRWFRFGN